MPCHTVNAVFKLEIKTVDKSRELRNQAGSIHKAMLEGNELCPLEKSKAGDWESAVPNQVLPFPVHIQLP